MAHPFRNTLSALAFILLSALASSGNTASAQTDDFQPMFNGQDLLGWHVSENVDSVYVEDGCLITHGKRGHAFYVGPKGHASFTDFHFKAKVKTEPSANSGIYFHTQFQAKGWPEDGYECQVNNTHKDPKKTGGLYAVKDNMEMPVGDNEWFDYDIIVKGKHVQIMINGKTITDYTEPDDVKREEKMKNRLINKGTIALQAHDPGSKVWFKDLMIKAIDE